jgi:multiple sugar transport system permease protein
MPIVSAVGRRSLKTRLLLASIYGLLLLGGVTMIYPFWLMVVGSTKSAVDTPDSRLIPRFYVDADALWGKFAEGLFNERMDHLRIAYREGAISFDTLTQPEPGPEAYRQAWVDYITGDIAPGVEAYEIAFFEAPTSRYVQSYHLRKYKQWARERFDDDIEAYNDMVGAAYETWADVSVIPRLYLHRLDTPGTDPLSELLNAFRQTVPIGMRYYADAEGFYLNNYVKALHTADIENFNRTHGTNYVSYDQIDLDRRLPIGPGRTDEERETWTDFVRNILNLAWVRIDPVGRPIYQDYLREIWERDIDRLNAAYGTSYRSFEDIDLPADPYTLASIRQRSDWETFISGWQDAGGNERAVPKELLIIDSVEWRFRDHLQQRFGSPEAANAALGTSATRWSDFVPPQRDVHLDYLQEHRGWVIWEFTVRNFITVFEYLALQGRGLINTIIYCALAILGSLLVNPLAAYALSRYKPPSSYKLLLIMMLTMAFPPMVGMIPQFLLLRDFGMLNTFWALVLPGLASGYFIFLLKGFFDSLPQELYEAAELDGAGELRIFVQLTMALSKPVLAVIALQAFTTAYSNFMFALLICQDEDMWTIMPWLYQLQQRSGQGVVFASLVISALPPFLIFAFCQNIIMRGIVVPVEK